MNRKSTLVICLLSMLPALAQERGTPAKSTAPEGLLVPMVNDASMRERTPKGQGELVFNKDQHGFYYFTGTEWEALLTAEPGGKGGPMTWTTQRTGGGGTNVLKLTAGTSGFWDLTGNTATDPATNFIGTTDAQPVRFRANNTTAGQLGAQTNSMVSFGLLSGAANTTGTANVFIGVQAGTSNTSGSANTAVGNSAGRSNTTGQSSVFVGSGSGFNSTGSFNTFLGTSSGQSATTGGNNTFVGNNSGAATTVGVGNVCLGANSGQTAVLDNNNTLLGGNTDIFLAGITNATAIGHRATVSASNSLVLGSVAGVNGATSSVNVGIGVINPADRLHVAGNIRMVDGNQAAGRVLTSDANGTARGRTSRPRALTGAARATRAPTRARISSEQRTPWTSASARRMPSASAFPARARSGSAPRAGSTPTFTWSVVSALALELRPAWWPVRIR